MEGNGKTFTLTCIAFLCKINQGIFTYEEVQNKIDNTDTLKVLIRRMGNIDSYIQHSPDNESDLMIEIFTCISDEVLGYCYGNALEKEKMQKIHLFHQII